MAVTHIAFTGQPDHGVGLRQFLRELENGYEGLKDQIDTMARMIDGDGSQAAHFTYMTGKYGFASDADAKAAYEELNSLWFVLNSNADAALVQAFNKFR